MGKKRVIVVGGGLAGLATALVIAEKGGNVDIFNTVPVKRSHSVCAQGGINGVVHPERENDSTFQHYYDTIYGGDFLANQPPVRYMAEDAPAIIKFMARAGVPFNRTPEGFLDFRAFGGAKHKRTAYAGATTGQQLMYALDEQVRRYKAEGNVRSFEFWEMLNIVLDDKKRAAGIIAINMKNNQLQAFPADAVVIATGGPGMVFGHGSTNSLTNTGAAVVRAYLKGAKYANAEFVQVHPTTIPGHDKLRLMSESIRGEGGTIWVPRIKGDKRNPVDIPEKERWYFLEEKYPAYGNLVPRDIATREIFNVCVNLGMGVGGRNEAYLDITHLVRDKGREWVEKKLGSLLDIYDKFVHDDPLKVPMRIFPGMHYSMGGLWVQYHLDGNAPEAIGKMDLEHPHNSMTNIEGLYAAGECDYQYHGANRLGANALLSCIHTGLRLAGPAAYKYITQKKWVAEELPQSLFEHELLIEQEKLQKIQNTDGTENIYELWDTLGENMTKYATVVRTDEGLEKLDNTVAEIQEKIKHVKCPDKVENANQAVIFTRTMQDMVILARMIAQGAKLRNESRGAHYKEIPESVAKELPEHRFETFTDPDGTKHFAYKRNDEDWLKTTICEVEDVETGKAKFSYEPVDLSITQPVFRDYTKTVKAK